MTEQRRLLLEMIDDLERCGGKQQAAAIRRRFWRALFRATPARWIAEACSSVYPHGWRARLGAWVADRYGDACAKEPAP